MVSRSFTAAAWRLSARRVLDKLDERVFRGRQRRLVGRQCGPLVWRDHIYGATAPRGSSSTIGLATLAFASFGSNACSCFGLEHQTIFGSPRSSVFSVLVQAEAGEIVAGTAGRKVTRSPAARLTRRTS
jgi:hypothetical protein